MTDHPIQPDARGDDDAVRAVAHLPGLDIEVTHRRSIDTEEIAVHLQAVPSFSAFGRYLESANPFALWAQAAQFAWLPWAPWLYAAQALLPTSGRRD